MRRYEVRFSDAAEAGLDAILNFIANDNPLRALTFVEELRQRTFDLLSVTPNASMRIGSFRFAVFGRYVVVFSVDDENGIVRVHLVTEGHRNWRRMLGDPH